MGLAILIAKTPSKTRNLCPHFWTEAIRAWQNLPWEIDLQRLTRLERLNFPLWENQWITFEGRPFGDQAAKDLAEKGIIFVKDLLNQEGDLEEPEHLCQEFHLPYPHLTLNKLLAAIPEELLSADGEEEEEPPKIWERLAIGGIRWNRLPSRKMSEEPQGIPRCRIAWEKEGLKLNWNRTWKAVWKNGTVPPKWNETFFLLLHRALWVGAKARRLGVDHIPSECHECEQEETLKHLFWDCLRARTARQHAGKTWITWEDMLRDGSRVQRAVIFVIWTTRCQDKIEDSHISLDKIKNTLTKII